MRKVHQGELKMGEGEYLSTRIHTNHSILVAFWNIKKNKKTNWGWAGPNKVKVLVEVGDRCR